MKLSENYDLIKESLDIRERKMNAVIVPMCSCLSALSTFYVVRFFVGQYYTPADGLYYYQIYFEIASVFLLLFCAVSAFILKKRHPRTPKYIFVSVYLIRAFYTTIFFEFNFFIFFIIPIIFAIGYYKVRFSHGVNSLVLVSYFLSEIIAARCGIPDLSFYDVDFYEGMVYVFNNSMYPSNRFLAQTLPVGTMLFFVCLLSLFLAKNGADSLLREKNIGNEKAALDKEISLGNEIQQSMLPERVMETPAFSAYSYMLSAKNVGGDFYDYFTIDDNKVFLTIGDVSGKGISASLFASNTKALIRAYAMSGHTPCEILREVNVSLCGTNRKKLFVTVWLGVLDLTAGELTFCNAGHNPPLLKTASGEVKWIACHPDFVIGRREDMKYHQNTVTLNKGDSVILYTDGITEAVNETGELFGEERLFAFAAEHPVDGMFTRGLRKAIFDYRKNAEQNDDLSVACLTFIGKSAPESITGTFKAQRQDYPRLCEFVNGFVSKYTADIKILNDIEISLGEIFSNIEFYSSADKEKITDVSVTLSHGEGRLKIVFKDNGIPFNPLEKAEPSLEENIKNKVVGGFGIFMVRNLMDNVSYQNIDNNNILILEKNI